MQTALRRVALLSVFVLATAPLAAQQFGPQDLLLSAPSVGSVWRVDGTTHVGAQLTPGVSIVHYGWVGTDGNFYVPDRGWISILKVEPDGTLSALTSAGHMILPVTCIPTLDDTALVVSDMGSNKILRVDYDGTQTVMHDDVSAGGLLDMPDGMAWDDAGNLYVAQLGNHTLVKIDAQGQATLFSDSPILSQPGGVAIDGAGNLFVANYGTSTIARFRLDTGEGEVFAGPDLSLMLTPNDLKLSRRGGMLVAAKKGTVVRVGALGQIELVFRDEALGELDGVSVPEDRTLCTGRYESYGAGQAGAGGYRPQLRAIFSPCGGQTVGFEFLDFAGGAPAILFIGSSPLAPGAASFKGAPLLVDPAGAVFLTMPLAFPGSGAGAGDIRLQFKVPTTPGLIGLDLYHQVFACDAAAPGGVSASNGLKETFGI